MAGRIYSHIETERDGMFTTRTENDENFNYVLTYNYPLAPHLNKSVIRTDFIAKARATRKA